MATGKYRYLSIQYHQRTDLRKLEILFNESKQRLTSLLSRFYPHALLFSSTSSPHAFSCRAFQCAQRATQGIVWMQIGISHEVHSSISCEGRHLILHKIQ